LVFGIDVTEPELIRHAVHTPDDVAGGGLCFLGHLTDAEPTDIVVAAGASQNVIEVAQTHRAAILVGVAFAAVEVIDVLDLVLGDEGLYPHFIARSHLLQVNCGLFLHP